MGAGTSQSTKPSTTTNIPVAELLKNPGAFAPTLIDCLSVNGFVGLHLDDITQKLVKEYFALGDEFFKLSQEEKDRYGPIVSDELNRRKNRGYIHLKGVKEFLKIKPVFPEEEIPAKPETLRPKFRETFTALNNILQICLDIVATSQNSSDGKAFITPELLQKLKQFSALDSSVSLIHYLGEDYKSQGQSLPPSEYDNGEVAEVSTDSSIRFPSNTHTDTGILTLISCALVPGLQVWDREKKVFIEVEKHFIPHEDMFLIVGRKLNILANSEKRFEPTIHRVALPSGTQRNSLLLFMDVRQ